MFHKERSSHWNLFNEFKGLRRKGVDILSLCYLGCVSPPYPWSTFLRTVGDCYRPGVILSHL